MQTITTISFAVGLTDSTTVCHISPSNLVFYFLSFFHSYMLGSIVLDQLSSCALACKHYFRILSCSIVLIHKYSL